MTTGEYIEQSAELGLNCPVAAMVLWNADGSDIVCLELAPRRRATGELQALQAGWAGRGLVNSCTAGVKGLTPVFCFKAPVAIDIKRRIIARFLEFALAAMCDGFAELAGDEEIRELKRVWGLDSRNAGRC